MSYRVIQVNKVQKNEQIISKHSYTNWHTEQKKK